MESLNGIALDLFYKIRSKFKGLKLGNKDGEVTVIPEEARFFDFDYSDDNGTLGHVSLSIADNNSLKIFFNTNITEEMNTRQKNTWYNFLKEMRRFAKSRLMSFDTRDIAKDALGTRDYEFLSKINDDNYVGENIMSESNMYGTSRTSYQPLKDTKLIIKHSKQLYDDTTPGARTRNISALFIENCQGERFKYPYTHLAGARAMQRHVANNGLPYDDIGESIVEMSQQINQLKKFSNYVAKNGLMNETNSPIIERSITELNALKDQVKRMSKQKHYESYVENFEKTTLEEIPEDIEADLIEKFTVKNFNEEIKDIFPLLYKFEQENLIGYDDILDFVQEDEEKTNVSIEKNHLEDLESWIFNLGEMITSDDDEQKKVAINALQKLTKQTFPAGVDGLNGKEALEGIIEDPNLISKIEKIAEDDPDTCIRPLIKDWLSKNAPDVLDEIDFGDMVDESAEQLNEWLPMVLGVGRAIIGPLANLIRGGSAKGLEKIAQLGKKAKIPQDSKKAADKLSKAGAGKSIDDLAKQAEKAKPKTDTPKADIVVKYPKKDAPKATSAPAQANKTSPTAAGADAAKDVLKGPANIGSKIAGPAAVGTGLAVGGNEVGKAIGGAVDDITNFGSETFGTAEEYLDKITDTLGQGVEAIADMDILGQIAEIAKQYALPVGLVIAALWGGSKILGWLFDDTQDEDALLKMLEEDIMLEKDSNDELPFEPDEKTTDTDEFGNKIKKKNVAKHLAKKGMRKAMSKQELSEVADYIMSFYDRERGTFPKGPTAVMQSVEKKFGETAGQAAEKMIERMAPHQDADIVGEGMYDGMSREELLKKKAEAEAWFKKNPGGIGSVADNTADFLRDTEQMQMQQHLDSINDALEKLGVSELEELAKIRRLSGM